MCVLSSRMETERPTKMLIVNRSPRKVFAFVKAVPLNLLVSNQQLDGGRMQSECTTVWQKEATVDVWKRML